MIRFAIIGQFMPKGNLKGAPKEISLLQYLKEDKKIFQIKELIKIQLKERKTEGYFLEFLPCFEEKELLFLSFPEKIKFQKRVFGLILMLRYLLGVKIVYFSPRLFALISGCCPINWQSFERYERIYFTHGLSFTAAVIYQIIKSFDRNNEKSLVILGAYSPLGRALSQLLIPLFRKTILVGNSRKELELLERFIQNQRIERNKFKIALSLPEEKVDIIVKLTSYFDFSQKGKGFLLDFSEAEKIFVKLNHNQFFLEWKDEDLPVFSSGASSTGLTPARISAPVAEVVMMSLERNLESHLDIDIEFVYKTEEWAEKYGLVPLLPLWAS